MNELEDLLQKGLNHLGISCSKQAILHYLELLHKWNQAFNLTAVREIENMLVRHVLDSLAILPWIKGPHVLDVGSGGGLPGIPLAIARPELNVVLLDSNGKKTRFLQEVKRALALDHVEVVKSRAELYHPEVAFNTIVSRAFSDIPQMMGWTKHLITKDGIWVAMKGQMPEQELRDLQYNYRIESYAVLGLQEQRCCIIIDNH